MSKLLQILSALFWGFTSALLISFIPLQVFGYESFSSKDWGVFLILLAVFVNIELNKIILEDRIKELEKQIKEK